MTCDDVMSRLVAFIDGELPPRDTAVVEAHLAHCADCAGEWNALRQVSRLAGAWPVDGADVWSAVRREIAAPDTGDVLDIVRSLQAEVRALRAEVADLRRQLAIRPSIPRHTGSLLPDLSGRQVTRPLI